MSSSTPVNRVGASGAAQPQGQGGGPSLSTYIYEHLIRSGHFESARALLKESNDIQTTAKQSPGQRNANGVIDHMDTDSKDNLIKRPDDLPETDASQAGKGFASSFLADWWQQFWDMNVAIRAKTASGHTGQYVQHNMQQKQLRQSSQQQMLQQMDNRMNMQFPQGMRNMPNGMGMQNNNLQKQAMANNRTVTPAQMAQMRNANQQQMLGEQMKRDGSSMDMGGQRPQSPAGDNAPSPKRQRLDNANGFPNQNGPNRPGMPGQPGGNNAGPNGEMLMQNGIGPNGMNAQQQMNFQGNPNMPPGLSKDMYAHNLAISQGMQGAPFMKGPNAPQGSPMNQQNAEGMDFSYNNRGMPGNPGGQSGNHALQDYQMQLMLLEQQNKKRLLMARQEQDSAMHTAPGGPGGPAGPSGFPQGMSPNRSGPSPNPGDQMKRATPQMNKAGLPGAGSPMPNGDPNRGSPMPGQGFEPGHPMPGGMQGQLATQQQINMMRNGMMMQPGQHPGVAMNMANFNQNQQQIEAIRRGMPNGMPFPGGPGGPQMMMQGGQVQQPGGPMGTPQQPQRNNPMPPPPAPGGGETQRTNPSSPQQANAQPPTPSQTNKANPKKKDAKAKNTKKGNAITGATPVAEENTAATPTPATPLTPRHPESFNAGNPPGKNGVMPPNAAPPGGQPAAAPAVQPGMDQQGLSFEPNGGEFDFTFAGLDNQNGDILENFDFDSFLQTDGGDAGLDFGNFGGDLDLAAGEG